MTARNIKDTICALAVGTLFATPAFAQDSQGMPESGNTPPTQAQEPTQESEDYQDDYRGKGDAKDVSSDGARSDRGSQKGMGDQRHRGMSPGTEGGSMHETRPGQSRHGDQKSSRSQAARTMRADSVRLSNLDKAQVEDLQRELKDQGFYDGSIDGLPGRGTRGALKQYYQAQASLASAGRLVPSGATALGLDAEEIQRVRGEQEPQRENTAGSEGGAVDRGSRTQGPQRGERDQGMQPRKGTPDTQRGQRRKGMNADRSTAPVDPSATQQGTRPQQDQPSPHDATQMH